MNTILKIIIAWLIGMATMMFMFDTEWETEITHLNGDN